MKHKTLEVNFIEYGSVNELSEVDAGLLNKAREAAKNAWAPYSGFHVGASVLLDSGKTINGNNQENASYPCGSCAERVALFAANANFPRDRIVAMAISAFNKKGLVSQIISPCGSCRQAILECEERFGVSIRLILDSANGIVVVEGVKNLLPLHFNQDLL
jgi:cytidine deaminase